MLSIGLFTYSTKARGSVVHATYLAEALTARGHDVTLYALSKASDVLYRELSCPVVYLAAAPASANADELIAQRIREVADGIAGLHPRHDLFHAEDCLVSSGLLSLPTMLGNTPLVRTLHHFEHYESPYLRACQTRSIERADAVVCVSRVSQRDVQQQLGRTCPIIGNGVNVARFTQPLPDLAGVRARFGLGPADVAVLSVGGVEPRKNTCTALEAMLPNLQRYPNVHWLIAGGASIWEHDAYRARFRERLGGLEPDLRRRIHELGQVSEQELTELYRISAILLCPSLQEGFGLCVLEAMAAGVAVVVSDREPFTEYLAPDDACFVDPASAPSITRALEQLVRDREARERLGRRGPERALEFSWDNVAAAHERLYEALLGRAPSPQRFRHEEIQHA
jgi:glycosyltransferase-like protein